MRKSLRVQSNRAKQSVYCVQDCRSRNSFAMTIVFIIANVIKLNRGNLYIQTVIANETEWSEAVW